MEITTLWLPESCIAILTQQGGPGFSLSTLLGGFAVGFFFAWLLSVSFKGHARTAVTLIDEVGDTGASQTLFDGFPVSMVQLEKIADDWTICVLKRGAEQMGEAWNVLEEAVAPVSLDRVIEPADAAVLKDVLDTSVALSLPVNYECRLLPGGDEPTWIALTFSRNDQVDATVLKGMMISITDRRILEMELSEVQKFSEQIMEHSGVVFSVRDRNSRLLRTNKTFVEIGGYSAEDIYFHDGDRQLLGESYDAVMAQYQRVLSGDYPLVSENPWHCRNGSLRLLRWTHTGLSNAEGKVDHIISVGVDITDLRSVEDQLQNKVKEFQALFENSLVGIILVRDHHIVQGNQICAEMLGYSTQQLAGLPMEQLLDSPEAYQAFAADFYPRLSWGIRHSDYSFARKNGTHGEFRVSASCISGSNSDAGVIMVLDDISEIKMVERALRRSEARFRTIVDKMAAGLALINQNGYFEEVNDSWCRITGYTREEARNMTVLDITYHDDLEVSRHAMRGFLNGDLDMDRMEKRYRHKDGHLIWVDLTASKIDERADLGGITLLSIINDISDRKAIEAQLLETNHRLQAEKERVQLLAEHRMAVIELFDTFRKSQTIEDLLDILRHTLPLFVSYRNLLVALRISRSNPGYVVKDLLEETDEATIQQMIHQRRGIVGNVLDNRKVYRSNDVQLDPYFVRHRTDVRSYLAIPIVYKDFLWGVIGLDHLAPDHFTDQDIEILTMVGTLIAMQMEEMTAKRALHQESDRLRTLHDIVREMAQARDNADILSHICSGGLFGAVHVHMVNTAGQLMPCKCGSCKESSEIMPSILSDSIGDTPLTWESLEDPLRYNLARPIWYDHTLMGVLRISNVLPFSDHEVELAGILAEQTGVFWELNNLITQREREAMIDPLTTVWNRRYIIARLEQEDNRISRYGGTACIALLDMGDFKLINDQYGHIKGDEVLKAAASLIEGCIRKTDYVGRFGGDEFMVFMPSTALDDAEQLMKKVRGSINALKIQGINRTIEVDYGIAQVPGDETTLLGAIHTADERMYFNKRERKRKSLISL